MFDLKRFRKDLRISQTALAEKLGIGQSFISQIESGKDPMPDNFIEKLADIYHVENISDYNVENRVKEQMNYGGGHEQSNYRLIPLYSQDVVGGVRNQECDTNGYITGYMPFVNAKQEDIAVPVTNNSMYPTYPPGTIVQIRKLDYWKEYIEYGQIHIIELLDDRRLIKEVRKGSDDEHFKLISHNNDYDDTEISIKFIRSVWLVLAKFQKVVM